MERPIGHVKTEVNLKRQYAEFDWLKTVALLLLVFAHSELILAFPDVVYPVKWFLLSCFFFVSGFLAYNSFYKREASAGRFLKAKFFSLYIPFAAACLIYFMLEITAGNMPADLGRLGSHILMLNVFDAVNSVNNWGFLWFIPFLLLFMTILCLLEKHVKNAKHQFLIVFTIWLLTLLTHVYNLPIRVSQLFNQYILVFMAGFWLNKLRKYEAVMTTGAVYGMTPVAFMAMFDFSDFFTFSNTSETLKYLLYFQARSILLCLSAVLLALYLLRKLKAQPHRVIKRIAMASILVYLAEPFCSYLIRTLVFGQTTIYPAANAEFIAYQALRLVTLLVLLPLSLEAATHFIRNRQKRHIPIPTMPQH
jgi:hypothetical protein